jgi:hypothetical protein
MTEWEVVGVIVALVAFLTAVVTPMLKLNTSIVKLTSAVAVLQENIKELTSNNSAGHNKLWEHNHEQDRQLADHETRITVIEARQKGAE